MVIKDTQPLYYVIWSLACMMYGQENVGPICQYKKSVDEWINK